jgi:hypothetical protein
MPVGSVGVTDNAPYHMTQENSSPTAWSRKADVILCLQKNKIIVYP